MVPSPSQTDILIALQAFLVGILPAATNVILSQVNRVPEPASSDFVLMTPTTRRRLSTNFDSYIDCAFTASVSGVTMTVTAVSIGTIKLGATLLGANLTTLPPTVLSQTSGASGGVGVYVLSSTQGTITSQQMASGVVSMLQPTAFGVQIDVHGPSSADNAQVISTTFRDEYAVYAFAALNPNVSPFYAEDPKQIPFLNENQQWETRWVVSAELQANQSVAAPQPFADQVKVTPVPADIIYPAQ